MASQNIQFADRATISGHPYGWNRPNKSCGFGGISYHHDMSSEYDPDIHHRRSIRLPGYDYSQESWYFTTICTQKWLYFFGEIIQNRMQLNDAGLMIEVWWRKLCEKFPSVYMDKYVVMPPHFHGIVYFGFSRQSVGATPCGRPNSRYVKGQPHGIAPTVGDIVSWFKTMTTNQYVHGVKQNGWAPFVKKLWQRNYYAHIIRDENELDHYRQYIADNPANWQTDKENPNRSP